MAAEAEEQVLELVDRLDTSALTWTSSTSTIPEP